MKKIYIKPETLVVAVNVKEHLMEPSILTPETPANPADSGAGDITDTNILGREVIRSRGAWEEW